MNKLLALGVLVALGLSGFSLLPRTEESPSPLGALSSPSVIFPLELLAGVSYGNSHATTVPTTATTLSANDIIRVDTLVVSPTAGSLAYTFPASSTLTAFLPRVGQRAELCFVNATTTAGIDITFAGGTGVHLLKATSTSGGIGLPTIAPNDIGCFKLVRASSTAAAFDIYAAFVEFKDAD